MFYFEWASFKTRAGAEAELEDMFATGQLSAGENPKIERRFFAKIQKYRHVILIPA